MAPKRPDPIEFLTGRLSDDPFPGGIALPGEGGKFTPDGAVQTWPGNTFICHLDRASRAHRAIRVIQEEVKKSPFARFFAFLPPSSFHMTVLPGLSASMRGTVGWPDSIAEDAPLDLATQQVIARLDGLDLPVSHRIRATDLHCANSLTVTGADPAQEASLRGMRQTLRQVSGIGAPGFGDYVFHVTLGYLLEWVSDGLAREIVEFSTRTFDRLGPEIGEIVLGPCEFCTFETMYRFDPKKILP